MFKTIKESYDKYILMDSRLTRMESALADIQKAIGKLRGIAMNPDRRCECCLDGIMQWRPGNRWVCDKCGKEASDRQHIRLSNPGRAGHK